MSGMAYKSVGRGALETVGSLMNIAFRNIFRNTRRTAFSVISVGIAVFFIVFFSSALEGLLNSIYEVVQVFELGHVRAVSAQYEKESDYNPVQYPVADGKSLSVVMEQLRAIPGVKAVFPRIHAYATLQESVMKHADLWGMNMSEETKVNNFNLPERSDGLVEGHFPTPDSNECAIGVKFAEKTGLKIGDHIPLKTTSAQFSDKMWAPVITGVYRFDYALMDREAIIVDFSRLQRLLVLDDATQQLVVFAETPEMSERVAREMKSLLGQDDVVTEWTEQYWVVSMNIQKRMFYLMYVGFLAVACLLIINTMSMIIHERIKEIGMMGSLGMTRSEIVKLFFFESIFLSIAGATAGVLLGGLLTGILQYFPIRLGSMMGDTPSSSAIFIEFSWINLLQSWFMGVVVASIFTLFPSLKSAFVEPVEALRR